MTDSHAFTGIKLGEIILFFGCQRPDKDYIYHEEFEAHSKREIVKLLKAFSRLKVSTCLLYTSPSPRD